MIGFDITWLQAGLTVGGFIIGLIAAFSKKIKNKFFKQDKGNLIPDLSETLEADLRMQDLITELRMTYNSSRAFLYMFHNGGSFYDGNSMKKASCIYESVKSGISFEASNSQNIPVSIIQQEVELVLQPTPVLTMTSELKDSFTKHYLERRNVVAVSLCPLKKDMQIVGFVGLHFCNGDIEGLDHIKGKPEGIFDMLKHAADCASIELIQRYYKDK